MCIYSGFFAEQQGPSGFAIDAVSLCCEGNEPEIVMCALFCDDLAAPPVDTTLGLRWGGDHVVLRPLDLEERPAKAANEGDRVVITAKADHAEDSWLAEQLGRMASQIHPCRHYGASLHKRRIEQRAVREIEEYNEIIRTEERSRWEFMTTEELAQLLRVPVQTVRQWRHHGTGPKGYRVGRHVRYRGSDIEAWLEERKS